MSHNSKLNDIKVLHQGMLTQHFMVTNVLFTVFSSYLFIKVFFTMDNTVQLQYNMDL